MNELEKLRHYRADITYFEESTDLCTLCPAIGASFYFDGGETAEGKQRLAECVDYYQQLFGKHLKAGLITDKNENAKNIQFSKKTPSPMEHFSKYSDDGCIEWTITGSPTLKVASPYWVNAVTARKWEVSVRQTKSFFQFSLPLSYAKEKKIFNDLFMFVVSKLNPTLALANAVTCLPYEDYKWQFNEFDALQRFYCLMPFQQDYFSIDRLGGVINGVNWITCLNKFHITQLGGLNNIQSSLNHESIKITNIGDNCLIKIGEYPNIAPVTEGIPPLYKMVSDFLRPIRVESLGSLHNGSLNGSINFDPRTTDLWLRRFDEPGIWPPYPDNIQFYGLGEADEVDAEEVEEMNNLLKQRTIANSLCPQTGYWYTPAKQNSHALFKQGELMPDFPASTYGVTIWYWDANQK
jgi:hypothetical protein